MPAVAAPHRSSSDALYDRFASKDAAWDGLFIVAVKTTGIFCRPVCPARTPNRENVEFFGHPSEALREGYRPCKRCRPLDLHTRPPEWVAALRGLVHDDPARRIAESDLLSAGVNPAAVRKYFVRWYGMSFAAYSRAARAGAALEELRAGASPEVAAARCGYESLSGFRDAFRRVLGRPVAEHEHVRVLSADWIDSPLGPMLALATGGALCLLEFVAEERVGAGIEDLRRLLGAGVVPRSDPTIERVRVELGAYFRGERCSFSVNLSMPGTEFQQRVWRSLIDIPCGDVVSYGRLAERVGSEGAQRAVGRANGQNRMAIVVPCHRVIRAGGALGGYAGGLWRKQRLLDHEAEHWGRRAAVQRPLFGSG